MEPLLYRGARTPGVDSLITFAEQAATALYEDDRVRITWLTGSLASGTADSQSDVDLRVAIQPEGFLQIGEWWHELIDCIHPTVWKRLWSGPPDVVMGAISTEYTRFDVVAQSVADTRPRTYEAVFVLFDKDGVAKNINLTAPPPQGDAFANLPNTVEEFIRLLGMLTIVIGRNDLPIAMEGHFACQSLLISLLLLENGIDRMTMGKRHVAELLNDEQRDLFAHLPTLAPTMESITQGRMAYARIFLPRARRLMDAHGLVYPEAFESATLQYLRDTLGLHM